ncbi:MAG: selenocysteine-specific translation elongation factor [Desulfobacterales bacterium]|nr:selenocysteine-specific translation elongation factor [Desulfobacterales bacterium]
MKQIILGTAGHIDHGKTSLIKAITGTDTDRLKEEKERGITIELGFASLDLPNGQHVGIVDVPGHEKFVKNMVAGATGIDIVVMVIAADEGVMPQTREHMEICTLLGIKHGFVALTKIDMVDEEWLELAMEDVRDFTAGTFLENTPIVPVSAVKEQGLQEFSRVLETICNQIPERSMSSLFRLPVDRVFTMKGFGTVITGSLISGRVQVGDTVMIYPSMITSKVRGIQVHNQGVNMAEAGQRTAINFQGLEKAAINRGEMLALPGTLKPSFMVDLQLQYLASNKKPIKNRTRVRFHTGTSEILGNLVLLDREELPPGEKAAVQLRLDEPVCLVKDDRFVIRSYSPVRTIGGGQVLNPIPPKHKRFKADVVQGLQSIAERSKEELIAYYIDQTGHTGVAFSDLVLMTNITEKSLEQQLQALLSRKTVLLVDRDSRIYMHTNSFQQLRQDLTGHLERYHKTNPLKAGMPKEELKTKLPPNLSPKLFNLLMNQMLKDGEINVVEDTVHLASHTVALGADQEDIRDKILKTYRESGLQPPYFKELGKQLTADPARARDVLNLLVKEGRLVKVKEDLFFDADAVTRLKQRLVEFLTVNGEISTPQFKEMTAASRKYVIPLIEFFDAQNFTIRIGDIRKLRKST